MFDTLKKMVKSIFGGKKTAQNGNANNAASGNAKKSKRRGRRGGRKNRNSAKKSPAQQQTQQRQNAQNGQQHKSNGKQENQSSKRNGKQDSRRHGDQHRSKNKHADTPSGTVRPGGDIPDEQKEKLRAAHESWDISQFQVEPAEGKKRFHDFDLPSEVMHGIADLDFKYCTEIQALSLGNALAGKNIAGKAQTGSGKTAAFLVAILARYLRTPESRQKTGGTPRALVLAPTRELVIQICKDAAAIGKYCNLRSLAVYGGMDYDRQKNELLDRPVDLLVATPGRLLDFVQQKVIDLSKIDTLVIDEADRMLDMGFIPDVRRIVGRLPSKEKRATMLYSATLSDEVMRLAMQWMEEPVKAEVQSETQATDTVRQVVYVTRSADKFKILYNHLALFPKARTLVFCNRKSTTEDVCRSLERLGIRCEMLSGDVNQTKRLNVLEDFRSGKTLKVVATDVAGRGIHVDNIDYVINYDFPYEAEDYVHRIGRTGRAGNTGIAISFADEDESFAIPQIEEYIGEPLKCTILQDGDPLMQPLPSGKNNGGVKVRVFNESEIEEVSEREAVTEEQKNAAAQITGLSAKQEQHAAPEHKNSAEEKNETQERGAQESETQDAKGQKPETQEAGETAKHDEPEKASAPEPGSNEYIARTGTGRPVVMKKIELSRAVPEFKDVFDKKPPVDESDVYSKPVEQKDRFEDWTPAEKQ